MTRIATRSLPASEKEALLELLPDQGDWTEEEYLWLTDHTRKLVEFTDGFVEVLPMPTDYHQAMLDFLLDAFKAFVVPLGGKVRFSGLRVRLRSGKFREPDLVLLLDAKDPRRQNRFWTGADLVLEVVSKDNPKRDLIEKRHDYAQAKIPEYWIVDPLTETILVYHLKRNSYPRTPALGRGKVARSTLLSGFSVNVSEVFDAD